MALRFDSKKARSSIFSTDDGILIEERFGQSKNASEEISLNFVVDGNVMNLMCEKERMFSPNFSIEGGKTIELSLFDPANALQSMKESCELRANTKCFILDPVNADLPIFKRDAGMTIKWTDLFDLPHF